MITFLETARRCQCLGDLDTPARSKEVLDKFCRNDTILSLRSPPDASGNYIWDQQLKGTPNISLPLKNRCGTVDPYNITDDTKCQCLTKEDKGANDGIWLNLEIYNMPFNNELKIIGSELFIKAKNLIEKAVIE